MKIDDAPVASSIGVVHEEVLQRESYTIKLSQRTIRGV